MAVVDELVTKMLVDASGAEQGMRDFDGILQRGLKGIMTKFVAPLTAALGSAKLFKDYIGTADSIGKLSASLGISGTELHAWGEAAARAGGSVQGLQGSVRTLQRQLSVAGQSGGRAAQGFARLGVSLTDSNGKAKDVFEVMRDLSGVAETMDKGKFAGLAASLRLDQGTIQLLQGGRRELDALIERQKRLGVYTEEDFKLAAEFNDAWSDLKQSFGGVAAVIMRELLPPLKTIIGKMTDFSVFLRQNRDFLQTVFKVAAVAITASLLPSLTKLKDAFKVVDGALKFSGLNSSIIKWGTLAAAIAGIALAVDDFLGYMNGKDAAFSKIWKHFGTPEEVKASVGKFLETCKGVGETLMSWLPTIAKIGVVLLPVFGVSKGLLAVYNGLKTIRTAAMLLVPAIKAIGVAMSANPAGAIIMGIVAVLAVVAYYWDDIKAAAEKAWNWIVETWGKFSDWFSGIWDNVKTSWDNFWNNLSFTEIFATWKKAFSDWWNSVIDLILGGWKSAVGKFKEYIPGPLKRFLGIGGDDESAAPTPAAAPAAATPAPAPSSKATMDNPAFRDYLATGALYGQSWEDYQRQNAITAVATPAAGASTTNNETEVRVGVINVNVPNGDPNTIANGVTGALEDRAASGFDVHQTQTGVTGL